MLGRWITGVVAATLGLCVVGAQPLVSGEQIKVGLGRRQLFLDNYAIDKMIGLERVLHQPKKHEGNPIIVPDRPWETGIAMPSALYEPEYGEYGKVRLWYRSDHRLSELDFVETDPDPEKRIEQIKKLLASTACYMCYAESDDGIRFTKPSLGIIDFRGSKENNLVWGRMGDWANMVMKFPEEPDPARRYKTMIWAVEDFGGYYGNIGLFSPDGLRWTMAPKPTNKLDHAYNFWYHPVREEYVSLIQYHTMPRTVGRMVSKDFVNWSGRQEVLASDDKDPPGTEFYIPTITMIDDLYLCFLHMYHTDVKEDPGWARQHGTIDIQLATSRDGLHWERAMDRKVFIPLGPDGAFDDGMIFYVGPPVEFKGKLHFYYNGYDGEHGRMDRTSRVGVAKLRVDGYASLDAKAGGGEMVTRPFVLEGAQLEVNADAKRGELRVGVLDASGKPIKGFGIADARPIQEDSLKIRAEWKSLANLSSLKGKAVRLKFQLKNASLYGFKVQP